VFSNDQESPSLIADRLTAGLQPNATAAKQADIATANGSTKTDLEFAQTAFQSLARGDFAAAEVIDWEAFQAMGINVGALYLSMPDDTQKADFRKAFIAQCSLAFQGTGASADSLKNWQVQYQDSARTIVAADTLVKKVLLITISHKDEKQKISGIGVLPQK
jgi:hypothetical protein